MLRRTSPVHLLAGTLLWAACGRIGHEGIDDPIGQSTGAVGSTGSLSGGASGSLATTGIGAGGAPVGTGSTSTGSSIGGGSTRGGSTSGASGTGSSAGGSVGTAGTSGTSGGAGAMGTAGMTGSSGNGGSAGSVGSGGRSGSGGSADAGVPPGCAAASFNGHNYLLCKNLLVQPDAAAACAANGMRLARVDDATENQWLVNTLYSSVLPADQVANWIWLGGSDAVTEGSWLWPDGTLFYQNGPVGVLYTHWGPAEPNNARGGENCLAVRVNYNWTDIQCTELHFFCCEQW